MLVHWIWLATRSGINDRVKAAILAHFGDPEDVFYADSVAYKQIEGLTEEGAQALEDKALAEAQGEADQSEGES